MIVGMQRVYESLESGVITKADTTHGDYRPTAIEFKSSESDLVVALGLTGEQFLGGLRQNRVPTGSILLYWKSPLFYAALVDTPSIDSSIDFIYIVRTDQDESFTRINGLKIQRTNLDNYGNSTTEDAGMLPKEVKKKLDIEYQKFLPLLGQVVKWRLREKRDSIQVRFQRKTPQKGKGKK